MSIALWVGLGLLVLVVVRLRLNCQITPERARELIGSGAVVLDVRTPQEFADGALSGAVNFPLDSVVERVRETYPDKGTVLLCHCASGIRSAKAVSQLRAAGYSKALNIGSKSRAAKVIG